MRFEVFGAADTGVIPEGSAICYWEEADFGNDPAPSAYRGQFLGWTLRDAVLFKLYRSQYTLDVAGAAGWLDRFGGFAQTLVDPGSTPTQWHQMQQLTLDRAAHYALRSYTNLLTLINFYPSGVADEAQSLDLSKRSVWGQIANWWAATAAWPDATRWADCGCGSTSATTTRRRRRLSRR